MATRFDILYVLRDGLNDSAMCRDFSCEMQVYYLWRHWRLERETTDKSLSRRLPGETELHNNINMITSSERCWRENLRVRVPTPSRPLGIF